MAAGVVVRGRHAAFFVLQVVYFLVSAVVWFFSSAPVGIRANEYLSHYLLPTP